MVVSRLMRLLKAPKQKDSANGDESPAACSKCGKRSATETDGLCNSCRFTDILTGMTENK